MKCPWVRTAGVHASGGGVPTYFTSLSVMPFDKHTSHASEDSFSPYVL